MSVKRTALDSGDYARQVKRVAAEAEAHAPPAQADPVSLPQDGALAPENVDTAYYGDGVVNDQAGPQAEAQAIATLGQDIASVAGEATETIDTNILYVEAALQGSDVTPEARAAYEQRLGELRALRDRVGQERAGTQGLANAGELNKTLRGISQDVQGTLTPGWTRGVNGAKTEAQLMEDAVERYSLIRSVFAPDADMHTDINAQMLYTIVSDDQRKGRDPRYGGPGGYDFSKLPELADTLASARDVLGKDKRATLGGLDWNGLSEEQKSAYYTYVQKNADAGFTVLSKILDKQAADWTPEDQRVFAIYKDAYVVERDYKHYLVTRDNPQWNLWDAKLFGEQLGRSGNGYYDPKPWEIGLSWGVGALALLFGAVAPFTLAALPAFVGSVGLSVASMGMPPVGGPDWLQKLYTGLSIGVGGVQLVYGGYGLYQAARAGSAAAAASTTVNVLDDIASSATPLMGLADEIQGVASSAAAAQQAKAVAAITSGGLEAAGDAVEITRSLGTAPANLQVQYSPFTSAAGRAGVAGGTAAGSAGGSVRLFGSVAEPLTGIARRGFEMAASTADDLERVARDAMQQISARLGRASAVSNVAAETTLETTLETALSQKEGLAAALSDTGRAAGGRAADLVGEVVGSFVQRGVPGLDRVAGLGDNVKDVVANLLRNEPVLFQKAVTKLVDTLIENADAIGRAAVSYGIKAAASKLADKYTDSEGKAAKLYEELTSVMATLDTLDTVLGTGAVDKIKDSIVGDLVTRMIDDGRTDRFRSDVDERAFRQVAAVSYSTDPPERLGAYTLQYKSDTVNAYVDETTKRVMVSVRGTVPTDARDLKADASIAVNRLSQSERYQYDRGQLDRLFREYESGDYAVYLTGHSLGGAIVSQLKRDYPFVREAVTFNSALQPIDLLAQNSRAVKRNYTSTDPLYNFAGGKLLGTASVRSGDSRGGALASLRGHSLSNFTDGRGSVGYSY
jgi:hypothetical protein